MELNRQHALDLQNEGKAAFAEGDPFDACPYNKLGNAEEQVGYHFWTRGWTMARSAAETQPPQPVAASAGQ